MDIVDIDLDIGLLLEEVPEDQVAFYFRASIDDQKDFAYAKGDLEDMADALAGIMGESEQLANMVMAASSKYLEDE